ncbi:non-hydrolyzing UDP-N-acetylglucosamine 2-epimerase [Labrenzia sp. PHM005]|uniref:non-hydrolyzing UDP-N-acetylglucosamine 2-epimerase n=1 Tax=Labrenzia sp. PHM005 TaxID=2590016 RepID=UPI0011408C21|nr:UDP-N-acetylglucosamine 2-epimerase (non-hydrolyzing) [Labrenzia sp. PHM005]QDG76708.1 UDP-N-acetylglucosamine 2-epimerase (non-hydrolyzing) [Labrenzia sp. PHM005]
MVHVVVFVGTRPEGIKMAPVVQALRSSEDFRCTLVSTGQHREMLERALADFNIEADIDLAVMQPNQTLASLSSRLFQKVDEVLAELKPDWVLVQGDTTTVMVGALCAFYRGIPVGHVEAGLRSHDMLAPYPEELNRRVASLVTDRHFAPTHGAAANLSEEGIEEAKIVVTGNTGIDALLQTAASVRQTPPNLTYEVSDFLTQHERYVLITGHRRENFGERFQEICHAISTLADNHADVGFLYPVHLNPRVRGPVFEIIKDRPNILLTDPQEYRKFVHLMDRAYLLLSDSGGVQEEAPSLGKPVLVMRDVTERPEGIQAGCAELVGSSKDTIIQRVTALLNDPVQYRQMAQAQNPYGDGQASKRIADTLRLHIAADQTDAA